MATPTTPNLESTEEETTKKVISATGELVAASPKEGKTAASKPASAVAKKHAVADHRVIVGPVITEKSLLSQGQNKFMFEVEMTANKISIKKTFFNLFGVMPIKVHTIVQAGKVMRYGRTEGKRKDTKKAIVTLKAGHTIQ